MYWTIRYTEKYKNSWPLSHQAKLRLNMARNRHFPVTLNISHPHSISANSVQRYMEYKEKTYHGLQKTMLHVISGFRREEYDICAIPGYEAAQSIVQDSWALKVGPIGCPETSVRNYHYTLRNIPEERRCHLGFIMYHDVRIYELH